MQLKRIICALLIWIGFCVGGSLARSSQSDSASNPAVEEILNNYIDALGGSEILRNLSTRKCMGSEITDLSARKQPIYQSLYLEACGKAPYSSYVEIWSDIEISREGFDGKKGWIKDKCGVRADDEAGHGKLAFLLNPQGALYIEEYFPNLVYKGKSSMNDMEVYVLASLSLPPAHYALYFSTENGLLVAIGSFWTLDDYRPLDNTVFPYRVSISRKGGSTVYEFKAVTHNVDFRESLFTMPEESQSPE